jgi:DNA polymerase III psi subunit
MQKNKDKQNYYLQTMGINPWVLRDAPKQKHVIYMDNIALNPAEQVLLDNMLQSVGLDSNDVSLKQATQGVDVLPHPGFLLAHPLEKRKAYAALGRCLSCI